MGLPRVTYLAAATWLFLFAVPADSFAQSVRVRTVSVGRFMQNYRVDRTVDAPRTFYQSLSLSAYDALGDGTQSVDLHVDFRYFTDFGLEERLRENPWVARDWNELDLNQAWVTWRPFERTQARVGRQFVFDALGMRDFDGLSLRVKPRLSAAVDAHLEAWGGGDVQFETSDLSADHYDVQGLPTTSDFARASTAWIGGARGGLSWNRASVEIAYFRRQYEVDIEDEFDDTVLGEERVGAAASGVVGDYVNVSVQGSYHTLLDDVDRAGFQTAAFLPFTRGVASAGVEYAVPIFDSSSIFNLFGANPHQGAWLSYRQPVSAIETSFELRGWGRVLHGDFDAADFGSAPDDATARGAALAHYTSFEAFDTPFRWRSLVSYQGSTDDAYGSDQWLGDTSLRAPIRIVDGLWANARGLLLWAETSNRRFDAGWATSSVLGIEWDTSFGTFSSAMHFARSDFFGSNLQGWVAFELEEWR